jgi:hypothetical protein
MGRRRMNIGIWWESQKETDHYEDLDVGGRIILKGILETYIGELSSAVYKRKNQNTQNYNFACGSVWV